MDKIEIISSRKFTGEFSPPPDKSISHRAIILSSLAEGTSRIRNLLRAKDTESTIQAFKAAGIDIQDDGSDLLIRGEGLRGLSEPFDVVDCGNSGTTIRLMSGVFAGSSFFSVLTGDDSLKMRPMGRIIEPLRLMGADISGRDNDRHPPLAIKGGALSSVTYRLPVASAQVKSSLLLAGLYAEGLTQITEPAKSRDHTERMLSARGISVTVDGVTVSVQGNGLLSPEDMVVPGDFSSASFFIVASALVPRSEILIKGVGINPTRTGLLDVMKLMGADIAVKNIRDVSGEPVADLFCRGVSELKGFSIEEEIIPSLIDEFPILCVAASCATGTTTIRGAAELRVKESDRIKTMTSELRKMGVEIEEYSDGLSINGTSRPLQGAVVDSHGDHRIAMAMAVAALRAEGTTAITGASAVDISFPGFFDIFKRLTT